jgi:hypothetical protein
MNGNDQKVAVIVTAFTRLRKCHEFDTDLDEIAVRQARTHRSSKIDMSHEV